MRSLLLAIVLVVVGASDVLADRPIKLDIKSELVEKLAIRASKAGLIAYVKVSGWGEVVEFRENHAVWLRDYHRRVDGGNVTVTLTIELHRPTAASRNPTYQLARQQVKVTYSPLGAAVKREAMYDAVVAQLARSYGAQKLAMMVGKAAIKGAVSGTALKLVADRLVDAALKDVKQSPSEDDIHEGLVMGAALFHELEKLITSHRSR